MAQLPVGAGVGAGGAGVVVDTAVVVVLPLAAVVLVDVDAPGVVAPATDVVVLGGDVKSMSLRPGAAL